MTQAWSVGLRCLVFGLVLVAEPVAAAVQSAAQADDQAATASSDAPAPTRAPQTRSEIERALDLVRREHEEFSARIGDAEPTGKQRARLQDLAILVRTLEEKLQTLQEVEKEKAVAAGDSFKGRRSGCAPRCRTPPDTT